MNRNESFAAESVKSLDIHLSFSMLEIVSANIGNIQLIISGDDRDVADVNISLSDDGCLNIDQPAYVLKKNLTSDKWMQITMRIPLAWHGDVSASTVTSSINVRGISGSKLSIDTSSGALIVKNSKFESTITQTVSSDTTLTDVISDSVSFRTVCGNTTASRCAFKKIKMYSVNGLTTLDMTEDVLSVDGNTISGNILLFTPQAELCTILRSMSGKIIVDGIDIVSHDGNTPVVNMTSVSGQLEMHRKVTD